METTRSLTSHHIGLAIALALLLGVLIAALVGWKMLGTEIFFHYAENALAWCM